MRKIVALTASLTATLLVALPASASGAGAMSFTQTFHNATQSFGVVNPCTFVPSTVTITYDGVFHITVLTSGTGAGTGWVTFTGTGDFVLAPLVPGTPTYTGNFTTWDGANFNLTNFSATAILVLHGTGSDGSTLDFHDVSHITVNGTNTTTPTVVVSFDMPTCG